VPAPASVGSPGCALRYGGDRGRFRGQEGDLLTASLSLFNIPVISASRHATRECCLCTHPFSLRVRRVEPEIVPTRFCNDEWGAEGRSCFEVFPHALIKGEHKDSRVNYSSTMS